MTLQINSAAEENSLQDLAKKAVDPAHHSGAASRGFQLGPYLAIARFDHWVKNVFVLPGVVAALAFESVDITDEFLARLVIGLLATGFVASSNYVLNEVLDSKFDAEHPIKRSRPVPSGLVKVRLAYVEWILLGALGLSLASFCGARFVYTMAALWVMGCIYNIPPVRTKDAPYVDVLSEAVNNPIRLLAGWFIAGTHTIAPASLLATYWMVGSFFMAVKRFSEYRMIDDPKLAAAYRRSFGYYNEQRLLVAIIFYASSAMLFFGAFIVRYKLELILSVPLLALVMSTYVSIAFKPDSAAQAPEKLYREPGLMGSVVACALAMAILFFTEMPLLHRFFTPTVPTSPPPAYHPS
jgi:decaprenyl-phosphate phosphoribosyltransferase